MRPLVLSVKHTSRWCVLGWPVDIHWQRLPAQMTSPACHLSFLGFSLLTPPQFLNLSKFWIAMLRGLGKSRWLSDGRFLLEQILGQSSWFWSILVILSNIWKVGSSNDFQIRQHISPEPRPSKINRMSCFVLPIPGDVALLYFLQSWL